MVNEAPPDTRWRGRLQKWGGLFLLITAGVAALIGNITTIRKAVVELYEVLSGAPKVQLKVVVRDVLSQPPRPSNNGFDIWVEFVAEKSGDKEANCRGELLISDNSYRPSSTRTVEDGLDTITAREEVIEFEAGKQPDRVLAYQFWVPARFLKPEARFRLDCGILITPWTDIRVPAP